MPIYIHAPYVTVQLSYSKIWNLRARLPIQQWDCKSYLPSQLNIMLEFELESGDYCLFKSPKMEKSLKLWVTAFDLMVNFAIVQHPVPRPLKAQEILFQRNLFALLLLFWDCHKN